MRVVGGSLGGRRFQPPARIPARPTTDLAREGLFNILQNLTELEGCAALDLFGGTGGVTYELASRGAAQITVVEQDAASVQFIKKTLAEFGISPVVQVIKGDVFRYLQGAAGPLDLIFADPPYALPALDELPRLIFERPLLQPGGLFVLEHSRRNSYEGAPFFLRARKYGDTIFTIFQSPR